uniref:Uncharacterized protein n=1 Tax=Cacopsylla melanoneura TaxID=428564 RepID=A0A8D8WJP0_9HEMI
MNRSLSVARTMGPSSSIPGAVIDHAPELGSMSPDLLQGQGAQSQGITHRNTPTVRKQLSILRASASFRDMDIGFLNRTSSCLFILDFLLLDISLEASLLAAEIEGLFVLVLLEIMWNPCSLTNLVISSSEESDSLIT